MHNNILIDIQIIFITGFVPKHTHTHIYIYMQIDRCLYYISWLCFIEYQSVRIDTKSCVYIYIYIYIHTHTERERDLYYISWLGFIQYQSLQTDTKSCLYIYIYRERERERFISVGRVLWNINPYRLIPNLVSYIYIYIYILYKICMTCKWIVCR